MVTIHELSKLCGVSVSTVSKALNGYSDISDSTKDLVIKTANEMGYFPNANARALKLKKTYSIGVLLNTLQNIGLKNEYFAHILEAFKEETSQYGYDITFIEHYIGRRKMTYLEHCLYRHFDGVCIMCADFENEEVNRLVNSDIPVLTIDYAFQRAYSIISDNYGGMKQLVNYIIHQGHSDIAYIYGVNSLVTRNRVESFMETMQENGLTVPEEYLRESLYRNIAMAEENTMKLLHLPKRPTCIIAPDDTSAMGVISAIRKNGLQIVRDISIAGYDGLDTTQCFGSRLTTVRQERDAIGRQAARKLIEMIEKNGEVPLDTVFMKQTLMIGNSVKKLN